ncbi:hypothetical protein EVAR_7095_1 [Eumeta japonica]|uniref:Uncharacterized protein n=1 Tax=Eumeta variegata TaxID=151549 RepID=A0A4C1Y8Z2_EUMVA|nr:hypothetical protein EVAR_7095_1 [Eumeta japonica]
MSTPLLLLLACAAVVESNHTFVGTNVGKVLIYHREVYYPAEPSTSRFENVDFMVPTVNDSEKLVKGIMAYDLTGPDSGATAKVNLGGLGYYYLNLQLRNKVGRAMHYKVLNIGNKRCQLLVVVRGTSNVGHVTYYASARIAVTSAKSVRIRHERERHPNGRTLTYAVAVAGNHTFIGTSIGKMLIDRIEVDLHPIPFKRSVKNHYVALSPAQLSHGKLIQGIVAYDMTGFNSGAVAKVTQGGLYDTYMNLQMKSDRGKKLHYQVSVLHYQTLNINHGHSSSQDNSNKLKHDECMLFRYKVRVLNVRLHHQTLKVNYGQNAFEENSIKPKHVVKRAVSRRRRLPKALGVFYAAEGGRGEAGGGGRKVSSMRKFVLKFSLNKLPDHTYLFAVES